MSLGSNIKEARKNSGLTQKQLSQMLGVNINTIQNYENGRREPKIETLIEIAKILDCSLITLVSNEKIAIEDYYVNKLKEEVPELDRNLIYYSPSHNEYLDENFEAEDIVAQLLQTAWVQKQCDYGYHEIKGDLTEIYEFVVDMLKIKIAEIKLKKNNR